jgi:hypothetical protein
VDDQYNRRAAGKASRFAAIVGRGSLIEVAAVLNNLLVQADQGFMHGQGIFALNFDFGYGMSSFVLGDVYGGAHLFGAGGRAGIRYQW